MNVGHALKKLRAYKAVSQQAVAYSLNMERSSYARLEENKTELTIALAEKIAKLYGMELNYFVLCLEFERYLNSPTTERLVKNTLDWGKPTA
jgi:transcriptional regulator with XRE-family HTH domain